MPTMCNHHVKRSIKIKVPSDKPETRGAKKCDTGSIGFTPDVQDNHISLLADFKNGIENVADADKSQVYCFEVK